MNDVAPVLVGQCGGCHGLGTSAQALDFVRGNATRSPCDAQGARIQAGNGANSLLFKKVAGTQTCGSRMPLGSNLGQAQQTLIRDWITQGALSN
ncbi:MAG: hypothetical protein INH41_30465 [Myxococcaceae bacterium]|nr:hypothetical protein [Myxococcaceae bacterium]